MQNSKSKNEKGYDLYNEIIANWGYACNDEHAGEDYFHPTSYGHVKIALENVRKIDELGVDDQELIALTNNVRAIAENATKRKFVGSKWIAALSGIAVLVLAWVWMDEFPRKLSGYHPAEKAHELYDKAVGDAQNNVLYYSLNAAGYQGRKFTGSEANREKYLKRNEQLLAELKSTSPEDYLSKRNSKSRWGAINNLFATLVWLGIYIAYFFAARAPVFLINRRQRELEIVKAGSSGMAAAAIAAVSAVLSAPTTVTVTTWSDGRVTKEDNAMQEILFRFAMIAVFAVIIIGLALYILPFLVIISYIRNYQFEIIDRIILFIKNKLGIKPKQAGRKNDAPIQRSVAAPAIIPVVEDVEAGQYYFVKYSGDSFLYFGKIIEVKGNSYIVEFYDDYTEEVGLSDICDYKFAMQNLQAQANWENKGDFYPCVILNGDIDSYQVKYEDGVVENVNISQLRFAV
jgi:hypothetical protein